MIRLLSIFAFGLYSLDMAAQTPRFEARDNPCKMEFTVDPMTPEYVCYNTIINRHTKKLELLWERVDVEIQAGWEAYVCDNLNCYPSFISRCPEENYNTVLQDSTIRLDVHVAPAGIEGSAHIIVYVWERNDSSHKYKVDYLFNKSLGTHGGRIQQIRMFPNPAQTNFTVEYNYGVSRVEILNLMGKKLMSYQTNNQKNYDISSLDDGIYLIRLVGANQEVVKTLKLFKKSNRP